MSNEVTFNENFAAFGNYPIYVHPKMVTMETIIIYPDYIFRYIGDLQFIILTYLKII